MSVLAYLPLSAAPTCPPWEPRARETSQSGTVRRTTRARTMRRIANGARTHLYVSNDSAGACSAGRAPGRPRGVVPPDHEAQARPALLGVLRNHRVLFAKDPVDCVPSLERPDVAPGREALFSRMFSSLAGPGGGAARLLRLAEGSAGDVGVVSVAARLGVDLLVPQR